MRLHLLSVALAALWMVAPASGSPGTAPRGVPETGGRLELVLPARRPPDPGPGVVPALPPGARQVAPMTMEAVLRMQPLSGEAQVIRQTISRTAERLHVRAGRDSEWLFERNPRDAGRAFGSRVDHLGRAIVLYDESDLRNLLGISGWAQVLALGFDVSVLPELQPSTQIRRIGGVSFRRYTAASRKVSTDELWWSDDQHLPRGFTTTGAGGSTTFTIEQLRPGVDADLLRPPAARFPTYRLVDVADWLEHHH